MFTLCDGITKSPSEIHPLIITGITFASLSSYNPFVLWATQRDPPRVPKVKFRVLIRVIGRANAGKTSILPRVLRYDESPKNYRLGPENSLSGMFSFLINTFISWRSQIKLDPTIEVSQAYYC